MTTANVLATLTAIAIAAPFAYADIDVEDDAPVRECPAFMRDSTLTLADTAGGSAFTITTPHAQHVPVLRLALREAAAFVERRAEELAMEAVAVDDSPQIPLVKITTQNVKAGLSMTIRARKLGDISVVRRQARMVEVLWRNSPCMKPADRPRKLPPGAVSA